MATYRYITVNDRRLIGKLKKQLKSIREIARITGFSPSTISREIKRNYSGFGYCCFIAHDRARSRRYWANQQHRKITKDRDQLIRSLLDKKFSPEQIAFEFQREFGVSISAVTIYRWIYEYYRGGRERLKKKLRRKGKQYRKYSHARRLIENKPMISGRPESVDNRRFYGDWEADLMEGPKTSTRALLVLVERKSKYVLLHPVENKKAHTVSSSIIALLGDFKARTITYDNGVEFSNYKEVARATTSKPFFCNPYHAWEKGLVENTIGLIREYFPKKTKKHLPYDPETYQRVQDELNQRPRKTIGFRTPKSFIKQLVA